MNKFNLKSPLHFINNEPHKKFNEHGPWSLPEWSLLLDSSPCLQILDKGWSDCSYKRSSLLRYVINYIGKKFSSQWS